MTENNNEKYEPISSQDIDELKAIYEDYLYMVRQHELVFQRETIDELAFRIVQDLYPECKTPSQFVIPWYTEKLNKEEKQEYEDYVRNNIKGDGRKTYISIQHIRPEENSSNSRYPVFTIKPYHNLSRTLQLPSLIEQYTVSYPNGATVGNTEFYIDGRYKARYMGTKIKDMPISDCINDQKLANEITIMLNIGECFRHNGYKNDKKFERMAVNVYAAELLNTNENNLLEILGIFAEKVRKLCHARYHEEESGNDIKRAQADGFLNLPDNFQDYLNIRNLMRHQWDTLDDLDDFSIEKSQENRRVRAKRIRSYLKFCDKSLYQRMVYGIKVLHQMQQIISSVDSTRLVRDISESNSKFVRRVKAACRQNPDKQIEVEMNYPLDSEKYEALNNILHKSKIFPNIKIIDNVTDMNNKFDLMEDYSNRSLFLRNFHDISCYAMGCCQRHGVDKDVRGAWNYLRDISLITPEECQKWQKYTDFRNDLAHRYFDEDLRNQLKNTDVNGAYFQDAVSLAKKMYECSPDVVKVDENVFKYKHIDGKVTTLDYVSHDRKTAKQQDKTKQKSKANIKPQKEPYDSGIEFKIDDGKIIGIKFSNNVYVNILNRSIIFGRARWYASAKDFNALQAENTTIRTDKELKVTSIFEGNKEVSFNCGDNLFLDEHHNILLGADGQINEFDFKDADDKVIRTKFNHQADKEQSSISFADGTDILFSATDVTIVHNGKVLNFDNRKEFAMTYGTSPTSFRPVIRKDNGRV